jgi:hypothetical protein
MSVLYKTHIVLVKCCFEINNLQNLHKLTFYGDDKIKEDEMSGARRAHGGDEKYIQNFSYLKGRDLSEDLGVDGRKILKSILEKQDWRVWTGFIWQGV